MTPVKKKPEALSPEIEGLIKDLQSISVVLETHDQAIFQSIVGINILQRILVEKGIVTEEEVAVIAKSEAEKTKQYIQDLLKTNQTI
jgi:hypothetical protein